MHSLGLHLNNGRNIGSLMIVGQRLIVSFINLTFTYIDKMIPFDSKRCVFLVLQVMLADCLPEFDNLIMNYEMPAEDTLIRSLHLSQ